MSNNKQCFIAMPIRHKGTAEHDYFKALYNEFLKPELRSLGYDVTRADEVQESGAITKDMIKRLAEADLVIADLTDLNPNVFYELGVRHSLRGQGTIMILDTLRTKEIPFDLSAYRVIQFQGKLEGMSELREMLRSFISLFDEGELQKRDNLVHDVIPELPLNALEASKKSTEGQLRKRIEELESRLQVFVQRYGIREDSTNSQISDPLSVVMNALSEISAGNYPPNILARAEIAIQQGNVEEFLEILRGVFEQKTIGFTSNQYLRLAALSASLSLDKVTNAIYEQARKKYPTDSTLRVQQLSYFANSEIPENRERVRQEILRESGIVIQEDGFVKIPDYLDLEFDNLLAVALDAYHKENLNKQALEITKSLVKKFPERIVFARNHARALQKLGKLEDSIKWYQKVIWSEETGISANWLGVLLGQEKRFVDATEAHLLSCVFSPDVALYFAAVADILGVIARASAIPNLNRDYREVPQEIAPKLIELTQQALVAAISCPEISQNDIELCVTAARRVEINFELILQLRTDSHFPNDINQDLRIMNYLERTSFAQSLYDVFKSELTEIPSVGQAASAN